MKGQRCYITDRHSAGGMERLQAAIEKNIRSGVDYLQIREKDLPVRELAALVKATVAMTKGRRTTVLVNDRMDVAIACGAPGVHLRSGSIAVSAIREAAPANFVISVSCHTLQDLEAAPGADFALFGPVFASPKGPGMGLKALASACKAATLPVFALGGVTFESEDECLEAGRCRHCGHPPLSVDYADNPIPAMSLVLSALTLSRNCAAFSNSNFCAASRIRFSSSAINWSRSTGVISTSFSSGVTGTVT